MRLKNPLILLFCLLYLCPLSGQSGAEHSLRLKGYQYKNAPIISQVLSISESTDGYLWIGTELGLLRYDGHTFKSIRYSPVDSNSLRGNYVSAIAPDNYNRLWLNNSGNLTVFDIRNNQFNHLKEDTYRAKLFSDLENDRIFICSKRQLFMNQGKEIALKELKIEGLADSIYFTFVETIDKDQILIGSDHGVYLYSFKQGLLKRYDETKYEAFHKLTSWFYCSYYDRKSNELYVGTWGNGLFKINLTTDEIILYNSPKSGSIANVIQKIIPADNYQPGKMWICALEGPMLLDKVTGTFNKVRLIQEVSHTSYSEFTFTVYNTNSKIWFGKMNGLFSYELMENIFSPFPANLTSGRQTISGISQDNLDTLCDGFWVFYQKEARKYKSSTGEFEPSIPVLNNKLSQIGGLIDVAVNDSLIWLISFKKGVAIFDLRKQQFIEPEDGLPEDFMGGISISDDGKTYIHGTSNLYTYDELRPDFTFTIDSVVDNYMRTRPEYAIHSMKHRCNEELWLIIRDRNSLDFELLRYNIAGKTIQAFKKSDYTALQALEIVEKIAFYGNDGMILTGLNSFCDGKIEQSSISIFNFNEEYGKIMGSTKGVYVDNADNSWIEGISDIYKYDTKFKISTFFSATTENYSLSQLQMLVSPDCDNIILYDRKRVMMADKNKFISDQPKQVYLTDIEIGGHPQVGVHNLKLPLVLKHYQNSLKLNFSILEFAKSDKFQYQYRVSKEDKWQDIVGNELRFEHMIAGNYDLEVRCINDKGLLSLQNFNLAFVIKQAWYKSWWFSVLIILLVAAILYFFFRLRYLQKQKMERVRFGIAQDLHDDIGSYLSQIRLLSELEFKKTKDSRMSQIAEKLSNTMKSMQDIVWNISPANDSLIDVIYKIQEFAVETLEPQGVNLSFQLDEKGQNRKLDIGVRRHLYLLFKEAINNTAKYSQADEVKFSYQQKKGNAILSLIDNGKGFNPEEVKYGNGIRNMKSRAEQIGVTIRIDTSESGTRIELRI